MKYIKNIKYVILVALSAQILGSCSTDYVEVDPPYQVTSESFFKSQEDYENALIGAYDLLQATYVNVILGEIASDNTHAGGESATDVIGWQQIDRMVHTPINSNLRDVWNFNFAGVYRASYIIENKDNIEFDGKDQLLAEAYFLRAYFNFELVKWFGGIPIKPEGRFELGEELTLPRASVEDVYTYIETDLGNAVSNLSEVPSEPGRATVYSAHALLGKVHLFQNEFVPAAENLNAVINSNQYHLYGTEADEDYENLFEYSAENSAESVFEIQYTGVEGAGFGCLQCSEGNVAVGFSGVRGYAGPVFESGYGFNLPTEEVYNDFGVNDLRRDVSILNIDEWAAETGASYNIGNQDPVTGHTGYYNRKYLPRKNDNQGDTNLTQPNNYRAIRYADVLLMAAEALNRGNINDDLALDYVNLVRNRAGLIDISQSGSQLLDAIYRERRLELVGEGHRFFDLVRTGRAESAIDGFTAPKNNVFPIPLEELQFSQGNWSQNTGY
ncbi:RagB/SusD family nutrient uptake outer membrane protein [Psychroflexus sp. CAK57W]|uniref:RagB/SusD family nutrient uptake outer membrane protein n=1 Tax=Psychroflexus curvus TaxID=2873595 RepID=UPI001CCD3CBC|nr:RagB/SusD family nutrient uptake outer membrane protein [Psychroflexus curvus]MBZ9627260.1 RagB/SusD family nutrient uptake outer membrane protein [Psychroflexus curvus]MBZ9787254.1 RagB/SusD family nutrient uptake outer membrane protein [Psychroflexus curvus]